MLGIISNLKKIQKICSKNYLAALTLLKTFTGYRHSTKFLSLKTIFKNFISIRSKLQLRLSLARIMEFISTVNRSKSMEKTYKCNKLVI